MYRDGAAAATYGNETETCAEENEARKNFFFEKKKQKTFS